MKKSAIAAALGRDSRVEQQVMPNAGMPASHAQPMPPAGNIEGNFPAGVYSESVSQAVAPFMGAHQLPTGQTINVSMNAPNLHLSFKEWAARGLVSAMGAAAAWPFKLLGGIVETIAQTIIGLVGKLAMFILLPTMLLIGAKMALTLTQAPSIEQGAAQMVHNGRHAANGLVSGMTDDLPPEEKAEPKKGGKKKKDPEATASGSSR